MDIVMDILIALALAAVVASLGMGVYSMMRGGEYARLNSNKWMRRRVMTQGIAVVLITIGFIYKATRH